jgi:lipid-A-disaccharide synthase
LVKTKFANIINIAAKEEIIPELLQSNCNPKKIFTVVSNYLDNPKRMNDQILKTQMVLKKFKTNSSSSALAANAIIKYL